MNTLNKIGEWIESGAGPALVFAGCLCLFVGKLMRAGVL